MNSFMDVLSKRCSSFLVHDTKIYTNCNVSVFYSAAAKGKYEIVKLLLKHGADPTKKNRDGATPLDLIREGDEDVADLLRGKAALLDAAKKGNLARVQRLVTPENINCRDSQGRNSTLLHLAGNCSLKHNYFQFFY